MTFNPMNPLIVQSDKTILLETHSERFEEARDALSGFAELVKSPEHIHTYRISPLSLWNAASLGWTAPEVIETLEDLTKFELPQNVLADIEEYISRYGRLKLVRDGETLYLETDDVHIMAEIMANRKVQPFVRGAVENGRVEVLPDERGALKHALITIGFPVEDLA